MPTHTPSTGAAGRHPACDDLLPVDLSQARHTCLECADAGHDQTVGVHGGIGVCRHFDVRADTFQRALSRSQISGAVVEHHDSGCHRVPFVDGTPVTRGSNSTAWRSARATALYSASVM